MADIHRRAELGAKINERYAEALATVEDPTPLGELARDLGKPTTWKGRSVRSARIRWRPRMCSSWRRSTAASSCSTASATATCAHLLFADAATVSPEEARRQAAKVTRLLRLLRAHGVITKVPKTHRYQVSAEGRRKVSALLAARQANTEQLLKAA